MFGGRGTETRWAFSRESDESLTSNAQRTGGERSVYERGLLARSGYDLLGGVIGGEVFFPSQRRSLMATNYAVGHALPQHSQKDGGRQFKA